jgi:hypothetical protein
MVNGTSTATDILGTRPSLWSSPMIVPSELSRPPNRLAAATDPRNAFGAAALLLAGLGTATDTATVWLPGLAACAVLCGVLAVLFGFCATLRITHGRASNRAVTMTGLLLGLTATVAGVCGLAGH